MEHLVRSTIGPLLGAVTRGLGSKNSLITKRRIASGIGLGVWPGYAL
ncbi:MAG: hypothetical protein QNL62_07400 [Gammaproteobacteria bacterium]|nr:hypothetical protein [Gammaproteobacteria bacterium]